MFFHEIALCVRLQRRTANCHVVLWGSQSRRVFCAAMESPPLDLAGLGEDSVSLSSETESKTECDEALLAARFFLLCLQHRV